VESLRDVLGSSLGRSLRAMPQIDRLTAGWTVACGSAFAGYGTIVDYDAGILYVRVEDPVWMNQMRSIRGILAGRVAQSSGVRIDDIHFSDKDRSARR
jgi:hypothetical protein